MLGVGTSCMSAAGKVAVPGVNTMRRAPREPADEMLE
jgi:hypothetical protein